MKKNLVVLINPGHDENIDPKIARSYGAKSRKIAREDPPISVINLGGFIRDRGYDVRIIDTHIEPDYRNMIRDLLKEKPLIMGFSVILGKFTKNAAELTRFIRQIDEETPIVWGGKLPHLGQDLILENLEVDYLVLGDGEYPFLALLECLKRGKEPGGIPGLGYRENGRIVINDNNTGVANLDEIYTSKDFGWDLVKKHVNFEQIPYFINLYTSRGCKFNCTFCYLKDIKKLKAKDRFRRRSASNIISEIDYLHSKYGIDVVTFGDDDFLTKSKEIVPVFDYLRKKEIYIEHIWTNIHNLTSENIELLRGVCQTVCYSIETASPRLQRILRKSIPKEKILKINKNLRRVGISTVHNFLFGIPTETIEETKANIDLLKSLKKINPHVRANTYILSPIPETPIFNYAKELTGKDLPWGFNDLENFHFRYMGKTASKFRPYLSPEENAYYESVSELTNELFTELNQEPNDNQIEKIQSDPKLRYVFGDLGEIERPSDSLRKYILDQVIESRKAGLPKPRIEPF